MRTSILRKIQRPLKIKFKIGKLSISKEAFGTNSTKNAAKKIRKITFGKNSKKEYILCPQERAEKIENIETIKSNRQFDNVSGSDSSDSDDD